MVGRRERSRKMTARSGPARRGGRRRAHIGSQGGDALKAAHQHKKAGEFGKAAAIFADLAAKAETRGEHGMATHLAYQAGKCCFKAGKKDKALTQIEQAIGYAAAAQNRTKFAHKFGRLTTYLRNNDMEAEADQIEATLKERLGFNKLPKQGDPPPVNRAMRRALPRSCATCGAPAKKDEIFFNEDSSADCRYCGSVLAG